MTLWQVTRDFWHAQPRERWKLTLGRLLFPGPTRAWLSYLHTDELLWRQVHRFPQFVTRIYRPYALRSLTARQRVEHMVGHYTALGQLGLRALLEHSVDAPLPLAQLPTKGQTPADLQFVSVHHAHREGEAHVLLHWNGHRLYSLSFLLRQQRGTCQLLVTRLQGTKHPDAKELIREATKGLHGLRPAVLMVQAVRQIARSMGCKEVLLVSHHMRVALNPLRRWKMPANLEALWVEMGARVTPAGLFRLSPLVEVPEDFSGVASHKRAEARRRADLLRQTLGSIDQTIAALSKGAPSA